ncbi:hypothetical protein [Nonomuraea endophytica]|uniref:hypothetical protein n=1 Tax=Nonomuraea endophytica TaxID=714136 RepID=UPI0037CBEA01
MTDHVTEVYIERCEAGRSELAKAMSDIRLTEKFAASCAHRLLPRPFFMARERILGFADELTRLFDVLVSLPERLHGGDVAAFCAALGFDARSSALLAKFPERPTLYGRADLYHDGDSFRLLEFNFGSALGGADRAQISAALLEVPAFRSFAVEHALDFVHTGERVAAALRAAAAPVTGSRDPVVGFVEADGELGTYLNLVESFTEALTGLGIEVVLGELSQTAYDGTTLTLGGRRVDLVLRYFNISEIMSAPGGEQAVEPVLRAHADGAAVLFTTLASEIYNNKGCLALLSDPGCRATLSAGELELVDRVLPWTRRLIPGELPEQCLEQQDDLIIKPWADFGGSGIVAGWDVPAGTWRAAVEQGVATGAVVQRRVRPRPEPVVNPDTGELELWAAAWDAFLTPDGYAGSHIRALPHAEAPIIGMGVTPATRTTGIFLY